MAAAVTIIRLTYVFFIGDIATMDGRASSDMIQGIHTTSDISTYPIGNVTKT